ncbi:redoxin domain-containing protein [Stieleria sp. ICT_E10.1]|uniref:redoxin domain-containing protein n=1 Tax=Stieleria sedimenti TaxID=2976331 RepID=UPI00217FE2F7|nr:redoxin domain-containing protein [Stieleria sedimenti]MCS7468004.1 redoxin domain-containing protein [Stieleria sedimenti]
MFNRSLVVLAVLSATALGASALPAQVAPPEIQPVLLQMIRDDAVHRELKLSEDQARQVFDVLESIDGSWFRVRIRPAQERIETIDRLTEQLSDALAEILDSKQLERLDQLQNQALGTRMIVRDKTATALGLSPTTRESLYEVFAKTDKVVAGVQQQSQAQSLDASAAAKQIEKAKADEKKTLVDALTNQQKRTLSSLTGPAFNFAAVKRMYPAAPELTNDGASWLQGDPVTLDDLKGKVVAVHFYAFQCINCRRNLPHYNRWHTDYADDGLVVIGIQTPETAAERSAERVAAALQTEQIQYPVLMDAQSANWKQWSNTMWPTVYLVDKQGFLRRWWQGEMNWKGIQGEAQMRETIEQLLAEE